MRVAMGLASIQEAQMDWPRSPGQRLDIWRWELFAALSLNLLLWIDIIRFVSLVTGP